MKDVLDPHRPPLRLNMAESVRARERHRHGPLLAAQAGELSGTGHRGCLLTYFLAGLSLNPRAKFEGRNPPLPASSITKTLDDYNMNPDTPILSRFGHWAEGVVHGDLGKTIEGDDVNDDFGRRVGVSTRLLLIATLIGSLGGVALGAFGAIRQYRFFDRFTTLASFFVLAMPVFVIGVALKIGATALNDGSQTIKVLGEYDPQYAGQWNFEALVNRAQHMLLPALTLIILQVALYSRYQRSTMLDVLGSDFLRTARARDCAAERPWSNTGCAPRSCPSYPCWSTTSCCSSPVRPSPRRPSAGTAWVSCSSTRSTSRTSTP